MGGVEQKVETKTQSSAVVEPGPMTLIKPIQRKQAPPRFTSPVQGKIVDQGADVTLECIVEGENVAFFNLSSNLLV